MENKNFKMAINSLGEVLAQVRQAEKFSVVDFVRVMETKFAAAGYRPNGGGGRTSSARGKTKILVIQNNGVGDFVIHTGVIREIRRLYPAAHITLLVRQLSAPLAELCPYVDEIIWEGLPLDLNPLYSVLETYMTFAQNLLKRGFDICYSFAYNASTQFLMYLSGAQTRITTNVYVSFTDEISFSAAAEYFNFQYVEPLATKIVPRPQYPCHRVDMAFHVLEEFLHAPIDNRSLENWYSALDMTAANFLTESATRPLYALCMGGSGERKKYLPQKYAKLIELIVADEPQTTFVILGGGAKDLQSAQILKQSLDEKFFNEHVIDLVNKISYRQSAAILSLCDAYIGNDTGIMHVATAAKTPVLATIAFPADIPILLGDMPTVYYPYGVPNVMVAPKNALPQCVSDKTHNAYGCDAGLPHCITQIEPQTIFNGLKILNQRIAEKNIQPIYIS